MENDAKFKVFQASAGAGKTFTLIKEYLKLCLKNEGQFQEHPRHHFHQCRSQRDEGQNREHASGNHRQQGT